jgi:hypothetical protein
MHQMRGALKQKLCCRSIPGRSQLTDGKRWYSVYTQPHRELGAQTQLLARGFCSFLPRHRKTVRHAR